MPKKSTQINKYNKKEIEMATSSSTSNSTATASCSSGRLGSASPSTSVICQEVFDETCQPSAEEISEYALLLGIDPVKETHLLYLAKEGLMQALPPDWKICYSEEKCGHYYYNTKTKQSQWDHPLDAVYREFVEQARHKQTTSIAATPITIDNSDDASQLDSGIRSLQGNDYDCDNTNNTNDTSSPVGGANANMSSMPNMAATQHSKSIGIASNSFSVPSTTNTSGFSGGVSRFLESRSKNFISTFQPTKNSRFDVARTHPHVGLALAKVGADSPNQKKHNKTPGAAGTDTVDGSEVKAGFTLSGTGAMFLKSRRQIEVGLSQATAMMTNAVHAGGSGSGAALPGTPPGVKGILRDSSLTDMRRRSERDEQLDNSSNNVEDKKSVRFNLDETRMRGSPEDDGSSSRRLTQSPEVSINSDDDADPDEDPWDDDEDDIVGKFNPDGSFQRSLNPFLLNDENNVREIKVITVPKSQTIKMLQAQSFSMDLPERDRAKLNETARSQSVEVPGAGISAANLSAVSYLDKLKDNQAVKPLYEDTDSESKGSSVRSFIVNKSEEHDTASAHVTSNNPFEKHVEQFEKKFYSNVQNPNSNAGDKQGLRSLKVASKLVGFLKKDTEKLVETKPIKEAEKESVKPKAVTETEKDHQLCLKAERERLEELLQNEIDTIKREHEQKLKSIRHEYELRLTSHQQQLKEALNLRLDEYRVESEQDLDVKRRAVVDEHKAHMATLQKNHNEILQDLERDLKSEEELIKKEHTKKLAEMRDKLAHELEMERQRLRETGEDRLYEKVRCEKRLLEDKYRCLKEKYVRLKTDVKLSLERRNRRREAQAMHQQQSLHTTTTGSETERSISNKPSIGNSENRSLSLSTSCQDRAGPTSSADVLSGRGMKPPLPPKLHLTSGAKDAQHHQQQLRERSTDHVQSQGHGMSRKPAIACKYIKHLQAQDDTTSISQSDTTISNNYTKGRYLPAPVMSDNGNSDSEAFNCNQENNNNQRPGQQTPRKKLFSRTKSASTSRLNSDNYKGDRPCTPVENLRHQLQKLEDLEDQFPENTLDTTYHLRYPFSDISNDRAGNTAGTSSELEFFKHRIHLERDSVRRAKESLRTQRTNFRARQREIKQRHKASVTRHTLDQLIHEEKELTEMEVNLHRTRALLGEKVIRLRHLEQSLLRIYEKEKPAMDLLGVEPKEDATLSDLSSHSSSGFSSTDFASGCCVDTQNLNKRKDTYHQESTECIQNLEILNAEIREILDILGKNQTPQHGGITVPLISPSELNWTHMLSAGTNVAGVSPSHVSASLNHATVASPSLMQQHHAPQSIPTLADRLETYRQLASGRMQSSLIAANTIVSQSPRAVNYTTSLVERTRDLRNWLRQAKNEHDMLAGMSVSMAQQHGLGAGSVSLASVLSATSGNSVVSGGVIGANSATQANL